MALDGEVFRATVKYSAPGSSEPQNVFYWEYSGAPTGNANVLAAISLWLDDEWGDEWDDQASGDYTLTTADVIRVFLNGLTAAIVGTLTKNVVGLEAGDMSAAAVSSFIQAATATPGRRGRKYVPGVPDTQIVDGLLTVAQLGNVAGLGLAYLLPLDVAGVGTLTPGLLSKVEQVFRPFTGTAILSDIPAYQRRRKPGVGS